MKPKLYVRMLGGLGNQLFQYAFARAAAMSMQAEVVMDPRYVWRKGHHTGLAIQAFNIQARLATDEELQRFPEWRIKLSRGLRKWIRPTFNQYHEWRLGFDSKANSRAPGEMVSGFWQTEKYFAHIRSTLLKELTLKQTMPKYANQVLNEVKNSLHSIAVHVRRGDYLRDKNTQSRYGICSTAYYLDAMRHIEHVLQQPCHFFVFSDDITWCKAHFNQQSNITYVSNDELEPEHDLYLMSQCHHQIISNSTFSWWGAWLNTNSHSIVTAPKPWFQDPSIKKHDIYCPQWAQMSSSNE